LVFDPTPDAPAGSTAARTAREKLGIPLGPIDNLIDGTALANRAPLVTRGTAELKRLKGLKLAGWY
jgi:tRNA(fMet)-specific endonuclease VapC